MFKFLKKEKSQNVYSPMNGKYVALENVKDEVFASKMMGDGFAIEPNELKISAPLNGKVTMVAKTKHAIGITTGEGLELLIHFGLDTVTLDGEGIDVHVNEGDEVVRGMLLMEGDANFLKQKQIDLTTMVILISENKITKRLEIEKNVTIDDVIMVCDRK
ncbi:PTS system IIA component (Glc family) [Breznakia blatticola]|uniref:PTS system IIA component (Glc family) n=1 Tax=Breznakia blatticola TaxID=1754012 RepID=A0A4R7ZAR6_9FIRM|nr:PTS glucose transporter subunit IIA [Breznakia blatticola]TDW14567.1 PTS system IIA component (Glc family) [Breznakia blatticola]